MEHIKLSSDAIKRFNSYNHREYNKISYQRTKTDCKCCGGKCIAQTVKKEYITFMCKYCGYKYMVRNELPPHTEEQIKFVKELFDEIQ